MTEEHPSGRSEWVAITCVTAAVMFELIIRECFHRLGTFAPFIITLVWWLVLLGSTAAIAAVRTIRLHTVVAGRLALLLATAMSVYILLPARITVAGLSLELSIKLGFCGALCWASWWLAVHVSTSGWRRLRWAVSIGCLVFVTSQPFIAAARAPSVSWPSWPSSPKGSAASKSAQIFLLLDELNFSASRPIVDVLTRNGISVQIKALQATGDGTAKVVPALFTGGNFEDAKPCGPVIFCGRSDVLDFSKVFASRADIDIVGFAMPYCSIRGLRFCKRVALKLRLFDWKLWACSAMRRLGHRPHRMDDVCANMHRDAWEALANEVEAAIWRAPLWEEGGFIFAHIPLPHPPGNGPAASLNADYTASVGRAAQLIEKIVVRAKSGDIHSLTLIIFSDHPLRTWLWCEEPVYANHPCTSNEQLSDSRVPLIVAGDIQPAIDKIYSNRDVFRLVPPKLNRPK